MSGPDLCCFSHQVLLAFTQQVANNKRDDHIIYFTKPANR